MNYCMFTNTWTHHMKLKTFNRYHFPDSDISCGTIAISLIIGKTPTETQQLLAKLRRKNNWSEAEIRKNTDYTYWYEAVELVKKYRAQTKTVYPRYSPPLYKAYKKFKRGETYLVCTTNHLQVMKDGWVYDACHNGSQWPVPIKRHDLKRRKTLCYLRLTSGE